MTTSTAPNNNEEHVPFLPENETEIARLLVQHRRLSELLGGILPKSLDLSHIDLVLDVACGAGGWALDMARKHPALHITAIDKSPYFIEQARRMALAQQVTNVTFRVHDLRHFASDHFTHGSFDLISMRLTAGKIAPQEIAALLHSLVPLCRTGGMLHWLEAELPITNSPAYQRFMALILQSLKATGRAYAPSNSSLGITACMAAWFQNAGCRIVENIAHTIDVSTGTAAHALFLRQSWIFGHQVQSFLLASGATTLAEFEEVFQSVQKELAGEAFCGMCFLREVVGMKLREGERIAVFR